MVKAALMARFQKFIVDLPSIVSQPTLVVGSQDGSRFVKATARQNVAEGYLLAHRHPEPAQLRGHIPPGLVHAVHHTSSGGASRRACQVGAPRRATRSTARAMVLRFTCN